VALVSVVNAQSDFLARARAIHKQTPLIDGHNDYPWALRDIDPGRDFSKADISKPTPKLMTDIERLRKGGVGGQFWSVYTPATMMGKEATRVTLDEIDTVHRMTKQWPEMFQLALTADDVERVFKSGRIASMIGMEGGHSIDDSLGALRMFYALGARYMTLTHNSNLRWADAAADKPEHGGLTKFGEEVVREMNRLGMLVDLSHVSPETMEDALRVTEAPVIFSHSSARAICNVPSERARQHPADRREERRRGDGDVRARDSFRRRSPISTRSRKPSARASSRRRPRCRRSRITSITSARSPASITWDLAATSTASRKWWWDWKTCRSIPTSPRSSEARLQGRRRQEDPGIERAARDAPGGESGGGSSEDPPAINRDHRAARWEELGAYCLHALSALTQPLP
jgi:hypothetical protein